MSVRLAVGMPVYNGARWLEATVASVLAQRFSGFELLILDNASTDETESVCRAIAARDPRVRYERNAENIGVARNFTKVFRLTNAPYFKWMCNGDAIDPDFLTRCVDELERRPDAALVYPATRLFEDDIGQGVDSVDAFDLDVADPVQRFKTYLTRVGLNNIMHGVYRSEKLARTHVYSPFLHADINMIAELLLQGPAVQLPEVLNFRRMHPDTMTKLRSADALRALYAPSKPSTLKYQAWKAILDYLGAPWRAPGLSMAQRLGVTVFVARLARWQGGDLVQELKSGGRAA